MKKQISKQVPTTREATFTYQLEDDVKILHSLSILNKEEFKKYLAVLQADIDAYNNLELQKSSEEVDIKTYLAFYCACYYPKRGMADFIGDYNTKKEAIQAIEEVHKINNSDDLKWELAWASIWNIHSRTEVYTK